MDNLLVLQDLTIGYDSPLIKKINCRLNFGEMVVLIGKNGSGKTSLFKTLLKLIPPLSGHIIMDNKSINHLSVKDLSCYISVVYSQSKINQFIKVYDVVALGKYPHKKWYEKLSLKDHEEIETVMKELDIWQYKNKDIRELSDGNIQKVNIARAIIQNTYMVFLDEPTAHLDIPNQQEIMLILKQLTLKYKKAILFSSHEWELSFAFSDKVWYIEDEHIYEGIPEQIAYEHRFLEKYAGSHFQFNFETNYFEEKSEKKGQVQIINQTDNKELEYWIKRFVQKNKFEISNQGHIIEILPTHILFNKKEVSNFNFNLSLHH